MLPINQTNEQIWEAESSLTIAQIFNYTPGIDEVFADCWIRNPNDYGITQSNGTHCADVFEVSKFYIQEFLCYMFRQKTVTDTLAYKMSAYAISWPEAMYIIQTDRQLQTFAYANLLKPLLHDDGLPWRSLTLSPWFNLQWNTNTSKYWDYNLKMTYGEVVIELLPPPYKTNCRNYTSEGKNIQSKYECQQKCLEVLTIEAFNKVPFSGITAKPVDYKHISPLDTNKNATLLALLSEFEAKCEEECKQNDCEQRFTITTVDVATQATWHAIIVKIPQQPFQHVKFRPAMQVVELMAYALGIVGTWFGVSVLGLNPAQLIPKSGSKDENKKKVRKVRTEVSNARRRLSNFGQLNMARNPSYTDKDVMRRSGGRMALLSRQLAEANLELLMNDVNRDGQRSAAHENWLAPVPRSRYDYGYMYS